MQNLTYAEIGLQRSNVSPPVNQTAQDEVKYASLWHNAVVEPLPSDLLHPAGTGMINSITSSLYMYV